MIGVIYWSGTGNTEQMAQAVGEGIRAAGGEVEVKFVSEVTAADVATYDKLALGCADMGVEQLEEGEFEPFYVELEPFLNGKKTVIFGSWGWGGTWLDDWAPRIEAAGGVVVDKLPVMGAPDDGGLQQCRDLGAALVNA